MSEQKTMTPAEKAIAAFGGVRRLSVAIGRNPSSVSRWCLPIGKGGTGGYIPARVQLRVIEAAKRDGVRFTAEDLLATEEDPSKWENHRVVKTAAKLTKKDVLKIRKRYIKGAHGQLEAMAQEFGVGKQTVYHAAIGKTWKDVV